MEVGTKIRTRTGEHILIAVFGKDDYKAVIVDRGAGSLDRYVVCLYAQGNEGFTASYYTDSLIDAALEYSALTEVASKNYGT